VIALLCSRCAATRCNELQLSSCADTDIDKGSPSVGVSAASRCRSMQSVAGSPDLKRLLLYQLS